MELKLNELIVSHDIAITSNRTIMELKQGYHEQLQLHWLPSNRTIMELKL